MRRVLSQRIWGVTCVTCHPTQVNAPRFNPCQYAAGIRFTYPGGIEGWVDLGYPAVHRRVVELAISRLSITSPEVLSNALNTTPPSCIADAFITEMLRGTKCNNDYQWLVDLSIRYVISDSWIRNARIALTVYCLEVKRLTPDKVSTPRSPRSPPRKK